MSNRVEQIKQEFEQKMKELKQEFEKMVKQAEISDVKNDTKWLYKPKDGDKTYFASLFYKDLYCDSVRWNFSNNSSDSNLFNNYGIYKDEETIKKVVLYQKIERKAMMIRDYLNNGWKPDWNNAITKYCVYRKYNCVKIVLFQNFYERFSFPTEELAEKFMQMMGEDDLKILFEIDN